MANILSVQYEAMGEDKFSFPFSVTKETEVVVWVNDVLQTKSNYYIKFTKEEDIVNLKLEQQSKHGSVIFFEKVGDSQNPKIVTIEKNSSIERKSIFSNFNTFRAESLNLELDNFIDILSSIQLKVSNSVQKSKLESTKTIVIFPKIAEGKGIYWGKNGELLNTDQNLNDLLNSLAELNHDIPNAKISATKISINNSSTIIKEDNVQSFLQVLDKNTVQLETNIHQLITEVTQNSSNLNIVTNTVNSTIIPQLQTTAASITEIQGNIQELQDSIGNIPSGGNIYAITSYPKDESGKANYLRKLRPYNLELVNISNTSPLILNFVYKGTSTLFKGDSINNFVKQVCPMPNMGAGRYYIRAELKEDSGKANLVAHKNRPYFGLNKPSAEILTASGCIPGASDYFVINDLSFYGGSGQFKDKAVRYMYLGYVDLNSEGEIISEVTYFTQNKSYESFLNVTANQSYSIPNLLGCSCIDVKVYAFYQNGLLPLYNQSSFNTSTLEVGINFTHNLDHIIINTAKNAIFSYYKDGNLTYSDTVTLKIVATRDF